MTRTPRKSRDSAAAAPERFPGLPAGRGGRRLRVCLASPDVSGPIRNAGIGTATTALAEFLAAQGHEVTVLYALGEWCEQGTIRHWVAEYARKGVTLVPCPAPPGVAVEAPQAAQTAWRVYRWLRDQSFDIVYFPEWSGCGHYAIQAKRLGLAFADAALVVITHSPTLWHAEGDQQLLRYRYFLLNDDMERACVEHADAVVSPSRYMLEWMGARGWRLPRQAFVQPNLTPDYAALPAAAAGPRPVEELVFFGRLEPRKGIRVFAAALDRLFAGAGPRPRVTFLGKPAADAGFDSLGFIRERARRWGVEPRVITTYGPQAAVDYLAGPGRLAVIASLVDNAPYTVQECLARGVPFLAARVGGVPEMVAEADAGRVLFAPEPPALAAALTRALAEGAAPAAPRVDEAANRAAWAAFGPDALARPPRRRAAAAARGAGPRVTVCLVHHERPDTLAEAVAGLEAQTFDDFEVVLVDDGSGPAAVEAVRALEPRFAARGWRMVFQDNRYLGAARNRAAAEARGDWLLFHDDDNVARPDLLARLTSAGEAAGADIVTAAMGTFSGPAPAPADEPRAIWLPVGAAPAFGAIENVFGDANALVRRSAFEAMGGFSEDYGVGHEDWEFFARAVLAGRTLVSVPEPLFHYRVAGGSMLRAGHNGANLQRSLRPYLEIAPRPTDVLVRLMQGLAVEHAEVQRQAAAYEAQRQTLQAALATAAELVEGGGAADPALLAKLQHMQALVSEESRAGRVPGHELTRLTHELFHAPSMRLTRPVRNLLNRLRGRSLEPTVLPPMTEAQQLEFVVGVLTSASWEATGPLRLLSRIVRRR